MFEGIQALDENLLLAINGNFNPQLDDIMWFASQTESWIPFYFLLAVLLVVVYKKDSLLMILMVVPLILLTDQVASGIIKPIVMRPRPSHQPGLDYILHYVNDYQGGDFGFISSHASNTFGLATYLTIITFRRMKWVPFVMYPWALFVCYSRVYLGVHYPSDIVVAAILGIIIAWAISKLYYNQKQKFRFDIVHTPIDVKVIFTYLKRKRNNKLDN